MVQLIDADVRTKEVLSWKGLHVFHYGASSCSQKLRIFLNLKGLDWQSHHVDIASNEHITPYYLGINPRGLVPAIVEDGVVHIESNDIMLHLEEEHAEPALVPAGSVEEVFALLQHENDLHLDLRALTFRFMFDPGRPTKSRGDLDRYAAAATGTVRGARDRDVEREVTFWSGYLENGVSDIQAEASATRLREAFDQVDAALAKARHVMGDDLSIVDVAWLVYAQRLSHAGYPMRHLHPNMAEWQARLMTQPLIARELAMPDGLRSMVADRQQLLRDTGKTLTAVCFPGLDASLAPR